MIAYSPRRLVITLHVHVHVTCNKTHNIMVCIHTVYVLCQALTCHYLGILSDELCACGLHALALPVETLRLMAADCLMESRPASQLVHLRYTRTHPCTCIYMCLKRPDNYDCISHLTVAGWHQCVQPSEHMLQERNTGSKLVLYISMQRT